MPSLVVLVVVVLISTMTSASHFRGGIIMFRPPAGGSDNQIEASYHVSWRRNSVAGGHCNSATVSNGGTISGEGSLRCISGCSHTLTRLSYVCTDFSIEENWSFGERSITFDYSLIVTADEVTVGFTGCCWIGAIGGSWSLLTRLNLTRRNDTGRINSTPRAITAPVIRLQEGCNHTIPLAVSDPDGDTVRCRWATGSECGGICNRFPGANLHQNSCIITYWANQGSGYKAAAIVLEDFTPGSSQPLSSVGLQFLISVVTSTSLCSQKPTFIPPTLPQGTCIAIPPMATFSTQLIANSSSLTVTITEIQTTSPLGTIKGQLQHTAGTSTYFVNITWTPQPNQYNQTHLFCYTALNSGGLASEQTCISLSTRLPPTLITGTNMPNQQLVHPSNTTWYARFDRAIQRPTMAAFITFYNNQTNLQVYQIDTSVSLEVNFTQSNELIIRPAYSFPEKQSFYIQLSRGIVRGVEGCRPGNEPIDDSSYWVFETMDLTPPSILFTDNPSVSNANISLAWKSNEDVIWQCKLITAGVETVVNCSGGVWKATNMTEGTYSLMIKATDEAGNEATAIHMFTIDLTPPITVIHAKPSPISNQPNPLLTFTCNEAAACMFECKLSRISQPRNNALQTVFPCNTGFFRPAVLEHNSTYLFEVFGIDQAGNEGMTANYTWETDFENPHIFGISNVTIPCTNSTSPQYTGRPEAVDNQSSMVSLTYTDRNFGCFIRRTWIASDEASNTARLFQYIHLDYLPTITSAPMMPLGCDSTANSVVVPVTGAEVPNPCNLPAILSHVDSITNYTCPVEFVRNWTVSICGKTATSSQVISLYDLCPAHACGRNETPPHGVCVFGQCQCIEPWYGEDCSVPMYRPLIQKVNDTVLKEAEEYIASITILQGTKPLSWRILSGPDGLQFNTILGQIFWSRAHAGNYTISLEVENRVGRAQIEWSVEVKPGYTAFIDHVSGRLFPKAQPVVFTGHVVYMTGNLVREFLAGVVLVEIDITSNGAVRTLQTLTTADGSFSVTFYPALTEYGRYIAAARHPRTSPVERQVEWSILGMKAVPATITLRGEAISNFEHAFHNATTIYNDGPGPVHGLTVSAAVASSNDLRINVSLHGLPLNGSLAPGNTALLDIAVTASRPLQHTFLIEIRSSQGTILSIVVRLYIAQILPSISVEPPTVNARVVRGTSKVFEFNVTNLGRTVAHNVHALLPPTNLISFISFGKQQQQQNETSETLDLQSGESAMLTIQMQTPPTQLLGEISTAMFISSTEVSKSVPISLIVSSSLLLNLTVIVEDEYTFFADGNPLVGNAIVTIVNYQRNIRMTNTGNGSVTFYNIYEDRYELFVEAPRHRSIRLVTITSIESPMVTVFLERQAVTYRWSVTPVSYEDTYSIVLEADFETHVPIPVVTVTPSEVDLEELEQGHVDSIQLNITNHGLIRADGVTVALPTTHPFLEFSLPNNDLGNLEALSSAIVTIKVNKQKVQKRAIRTILTRIIYTVQVTHSYVCRETQHRTTPVILRKDVLHNISEPFILTGPQGSTVMHSFQRFRRGRGGRISIPNSPVILPIFVGGGEGRGGGLPRFDAIPYTAETPAFCDKCLQAVVGCVPTPVFPLSGCIPLILSGTNPFSSVNNALKWIGCVTGIRWITLYNCFSGLAENCLGIVTLGGGRQKRTLSSRVDELVESIFPIGQSMKFGVEILGDEVWLSVGDPGFLSSVYQVMDDGSELGVLISNTELSSILALRPPNGTDTAMVRKLVERLNNTIHGWTTGQLEPEGGSNMASFSSARKYENDIMSFNEKATSKGFSSYLDAYATARNDINRLSRWEEEEGVCAVVRIRIEQELAVTREAFLAKLEIENMENLPLRQMELEIIIVDPSDGKIATNLFSIGNETLSGSLTKVGSKWLLPSGASGQAEWLIAPYSEAAPQSDRVYDIRGTLRYMLGNENITIPLLPTLITVTPDPSLIVHYFWEKFVIGDDPFTDRKELSVPFTLGVAIKNVGAGVATDLRITSGQPEIIENEKGLAVSFMIIGANVGKESITPSLTVNFGDLSSNTTTVARWLMISSLQGEFKNYSAVFENKNPLGDPKLSILDELQIHELFRNVKIYNDSEDDGILDFLVSKRTDLPSELYSSKTLTRYDVEQGEVLSVRTTSAGSNSLEVTTIANNTGWVYYRYTDTQNILTNTAQTVNAMKQEENETYQIPFINTWITRDSNSRGSETFYLHVLDFIQSTDEVIFTVTLCHTNCSSIGMPFIPPDRLVPTRPPVNTGDAANISGYTALIILLAAVTLAI